MSRYPLEAVETIRAVARTDAELRLAEAIGALSLAEEGTRVAQERWRAHRALVIRARQALGTSEPRTIADLTRDRAHLARLEAEARSLFQALGTALARERAALAALEEARSGLADAHAAETLITRHRERWRKDQARAVEKREELEREER